MVGNVVIIKRLIELGADLTALVNDPFVSATAGFTGGKQVSVLHKVLLLLLLLLLLFTLSNYHFPMFDHYN